MKKLILMSLAIAAMTLVVSCKKDHSCECNGVGVAFSYDTVFYDLSKKDAEAKCNSLDFNFFGFGQECELE